MLLLLLMLLLRRRRRQAAELESEIIKVRPIPDMVHGLMHRKVRGTMKGCGHGKR